VKTGIPYGNGAEGGARCFIGHVPLLHGCVTVPLTVTWPAAWTNVTGQVGGLSHADAAPPKRCAKTEWLLASRLSATSLRRQLLVAWPDFAASAS